MYQVAVSCLGLTSRALSPLVYILLHVIQREHKLKALVEGGTDASSRLITNSAYPRGSRLGFLVAGTPESPERESLAR